MVGAPLPWQVSVCTSNTYCSPQIAAAGLRVQWATEHTALVLYISEDMNHFLETGIFACVLLFEILSALCTADTNDPIPVRPSPACSPCMLQLRRL